MPETRSAWLAEATRQLAIEGPYGATLAPAIAMLRLLEALEMDDIPGPYIGICAKSVRVVWENDRRGSRRSSPSVASTSAACGGIPGST